MKNDDAWEIIFEEENILDAVEKNGYFHITSEEINKRREARLMTKFDHQVQLPKIFQDNGLSIQPVSRGGYLIGCFSSYFSLPGNKELPDIQYCDLPSNIETIVFNKITTESSALLCAYLSGMLTDILEEETFFTVFGRMSTGRFNYEIDDSKTGKTHNIEVNNSQCEIDGGFEGGSKFAIIEAKCQSVEDFIVRQLYYPYRLWRAKIDKDIIPIFLSFSNNIFTFYVFDFLNAARYNSIQLKSIYRYCIGKYEIDLSDIRSILDNINSFEDETLTFPQADKFIRVIDLLDKLYIQEEPLSIEEIAVEYAFDVRQANYYISAGVYLGFFEKVEGSGYILSNKGKTIANLDPKRKNLELVRAILSHKVFHLVLSEYLENSAKPDRQKIISIMHDNLNRLSPTTIRRRSQTVDKWVEWILQLTSI